MSTRIILTGICLLMISSFSAGIYAQDFKKLVMPGRVIEGHVDIEGDCSACHDSQSDRPMATLCVACHEDVGKDRDNSIGFHGRSETARRNECVVCHTDHEGRDADIVPVDGGLFDHEFSDFLLLGAHLGTSCGDCHAAGEKRRDAPVRCADCHVKDDVHESALGGACQECHTEFRWSDTDFDHSGFGYALAGAHIEVKCVDCHRGNVYAGTPEQCVACHAIDDVHDGGNGAACSDCHTTTTWRGIDFDHLAETGFQLQDGHRGLNCQDCHAREDFKDGLDSTCAGCHLGEDDHQRRNGTECEACHVATDWSDSLFDHGDTNFALQDSHAELYCTACHKDKIDVPLSTSCAGCHTFDDSHGGQLGEDCGNCHQQTKWHTGIAFDHDLSVFPLNGMHAVVPCSSCHDSNQFRDAPAECVACHRADDVHDGTLADDCSTCHTGNAWQNVTFNHGTDTDFPLNGAHAVVQCSGCHRDATASLSEVPSTCGGCHRTDDVHAGQFGSDCAECHNAATFSDIEQL